MILAPLLAATLGQVMVMDEGSRLGRKLNLNFVGTAVTCVSNGASQATCTVTGGGGGAPGGSAGNLQINDGVGGFGAYAGTGAAPANQWLLSLNASGVATWSQPAFSNISGTATAAQLPAATGAAQGAIVLTGDLGGTAASPSVVDDSHAHTTTTISGLDAGADFTAGLLPGARGGGGAALPTCAGTDKLTANGSVWSCATDQTGGAGSSNFVEVTVPFPATGSDMVSTVVSAVWVTATSKIVCSPTMLATATRNEGDEDANVENLHATIHTRSPGVGFTLVVTPDTGDASGDYKFHCIGG